MESGTNSRPPDGFAHAAALSILTFHAPDVAMDRDSEAWSALKRASSRDHAVAAEHHLDISEKPLEARAGIEPTCKDLQSSA
jgi:hypothetical protein